MVGALLHTRRGSWRACRERTRMSSDERTATNSMMERGIHRAYSAANRWARLMHRS